MVSPGRLPNRYPLTECFKFASSRLSGVASVFSLKISHSVVNSLVTSSGDPSARAYAGSVTTMVPTSPRYTSTSGVTWLWYSHTLELGSPGRGPDSGTTRHV